MVRRNKVKNITRFQCCFFNNLAFECFEIKWIKTINSVVQLIVKAKAEMLMYFYVNCTP